MSTRTPASHWNAVEAVLGAVLDAPADQRAALLQKLSAGDEDVLQEVQSLLHAHGHAEEFLETSASAFAASHLFDPDSTDPARARGAIVGRYRLVEEIGHGGMGAVWLAERADGHFTQRVALKLVKRGMDSDEILERFLRERQILARLEHPHIARLLDGGVSEDGRPYFAMEYVPGAPITTYCDMRKASVEERLRLFVPVCRAVEYAHRNLIVHRDLKPSNVVAGNDGKAKLLDFGIAKLLGADGPEGDQTGGAVQLMTPEYASPEQVSGTRITTASDVYQLGAILYELLTGRRPQTGDRVTPIDLKRASPYRALLPPSAAVKGDRAGPLSGDKVTRTVDPARVAADRDTTLERLERRLQGDLDTIVMTAMRSEPDRRYPTADAIADDIERHLALQPIRFGSDAFSYRAAKFVRRHRYRVGSSVLLLAALVFGASMYAIQVRNERALTQLEAAKSAQNAEVMQGFLASWDPNAAVDPSSAIRDAVVRAESDLRNQPEMLASAFSALGGLFITLRLNSAADSLLTRALMLQEGLHKGPNADKAATLARRAHLQFVMGDYEGSIASARRSWASYLAAFGRWHPETLRIQRELAIRLRSVGGYVEAGTLLRDVLRALEARGSRSSPFGLETASLLGYNLFLEGKYGEAIPLLRAALEGQRKVLGEGYGPTLSTMRWLASALRDNGDLDEAEVIYRDAVRVAQHLYGEDNQHTVYGKQVLSILLERKGELAEAEALARSQIPASAKLLAPNHPHVVIERGRLGGILLDRGNRSEAETILRAALRDMRRNPPDPADLTDVLNRLAYILVARDAADADKIYREASAFYRTKSATAPAFVTDGLHFLAWAQHEKGDLSDAESSYRRSLSLYTRQLPPGHVYRAAAATGLGAVLLQGNRAGEAERYLREAVVQWERNAAPDSVRLAEARALLFQAAGHRQQMR